MARFREIIAAFRALPNPPKIAILTPPPIFPEAFPNRRGRHHWFHAAILPLLEEIAIAEDLPIIDVHGHLATRVDLSQDGVHFEPEGYVEIAKAAKAGLKRIWLGLFSPQ